MCQIIKYIHKLQKIGFIQAYMSYVCKDVNFYPELETKNRYACKTKYDGTVGSLLSLCNEVRLNVYYKGIMLTIEQLAFLYNSLSSFKDLKKTFSDFALDGDVSRFTYSEMGKFHSSLQTDIETTRKLASYFGSDISQVYDGEDLEGMLKAIYVIGYNVCGDNQYPIFDESYKIYALLVGFLDGKKPNKGVDVNYKDFNKCYHRIKDLISPATYCIHKGILVLRKTLMCAVDYEKGDIGNYCIDEQCKYKEKTEERRLHESITQLMVPLTDFRENIELEYYINRYFQGGDVVKKKGGRIELLDVYTVEGYKDGDVMCHKKGESGPNINLDRNRDGLINEEDLEYFF